MRRLSLACLFVMELGMGAMDPSVLRENPGMPERMCWAHACGWGFNVNQAFDPPDLFARLYDRTLLGEHVGTDLGVTSSTRDQVRTALQYGIDGFCVDIPRLDGYGSLERFYRAAEGLPFKVALCVDGWPGEIDAVVDALASFFSVWGQHPNNYFIAGRPLAFIYQTGRSATDSAEIVRRLAARGQRPYWLVQAQGEGTLWEDGQALAEHLRVFDGLYDFGVNGRTPEEMVRRLTNGREALSAAPAGTVPRLLCAGVTQGYLGPHNGFYRPYLGTGTLRDNWAAAVAVQADWVCLCTWNDYNETTHFEPSVWGRDSLLQVNAEYVRQWRGAALPGRPPRVIVSYREEACLGDDVTLEVLSLPYTTAPARCGVRILDMAGVEVMGFAPVELDPASIQARTLRLETPGLAGPRLLRVQARVASGAGSEAPAAAESAAGAWRELYPVVVRPGIVRAWRTLRFDLGEILPSPAVTLAAGGDGTGITATFESWSWWGTADLVRNGRELRAQAIAKFGPVTTTVRFPVTDADRRTPEDMYVIRLQRHDWKLGFAPPVVLPPPGGADAGDEVVLPVIVRGADSDEAWGDHAWRGPWRLAAPEVREARVPAASVFQVVLPLDRDSGTDCEDRGGWSVPARRGAASPWGQVKPELQPQWAQTDGPGGVRRTCLRCDGVDDNVTFPFRTLPHGPLTLEVVLRLATVGGREMAVFSDQNGGLSLTVDAEGRAVLTRLGTACRSATALAAGRWYHLAGTYDGRALRLTVDGQPSAEVAAPPTICAINSRPVLGAQVREGQPLSHFLAADLAGFALAARPLTPAEYRLRAAAVLP